MHRRRMLAGMAGVTAAVAGCLGGSNGSSPEASFRVESELGELNVRHESGDVVEAQNIRVTFLGEGVDSSDGTTLDELTDLDAAENFEPGEETTIPTPRIERDGPVTDVRFVWAPPDESESGTTLHSTRVELLPPTPDAAIEFDADEDDNQIPILHTSGDSFAVDNVQIKIGDGSTTTVRGTELAEVTDATSGDEFSPGDAIIVGGSGAGSSVLRADSGNRITVELVWAPGDEPLVVFSDAILSDVDLALDSAHPNVN